MAGTYILKKSTNGKYFFNLVADNHEKVLTSEMYNQKASALDGIESVKKNSGNASNFEHKVSKKGQPFFVLKAANHQVIGTSEEYSSKSAMEGGIAAVMKLGPKAVLKDEA